MESENKINFLEIINSGLIENLKFDISLMQMAITLMVSFSVGLFIYILYRRVFSGVLYSKSFNVSLIGMTLITSVIIIAIGSNFILSMGMVGALSIVRFRTPIKDPMDLVFLFWAVSIGIVSGAGFYSLAIFGSVIVGLVLFIFIKKANFEDPYLLVVNCAGDESEKEMYAKVAQLANRYNVKQKTVTTDNIEITLELRLKDNEPVFVNGISGIAGVKNAVLISYSGDYVS